MNNQNAISAQKGQFLKTLHKQTRALNSSVSREKSTLARTIFGLNHRLNNEKGVKISSCLKRVKNSLERVKLLIRELDYKIIHSRGKVIPLDRWNEVLFLLKKSIISFGAVKNPNSLFC